MSDTPNAVPAKAFQNPLEGRIGIKVFAGLVLAGAVVLLIESSEDITWPIPTKTTILQTYIIIVAIGWYAFSASSGKRSFFDDCGTAYVFCAPIAAMTLTQSPVLFWISLVVAVIWGVIEGLDSAPQGTSDWDIVLRGVYSAWVVAGGVITLGSTSIFPYSQPALALSEIHFFLNVRLVLTSLILLLLLGDSLVKAFNQGPPAIRPLPDLRISETANTGDALVSSIIQPVVVVLNVILLVVQRITNAIWHLIVLLFVYLYRTGANLANHILDLLFTTRLWLGIIRVLLSFLLVVAFTTLIQSLSTDLVDYIRANTSLFDISAHNFWTLLVAGVLFAVTLGAIVMLCALWGVSQRALNQAPFGGAIILFAGWLSGGLMYLFSYINLAKILGFSSLGLYSLLLILFVAGVFAFQVLKRVGV